LGRAGDIPRAQASALALVLAAVTLVVLVLLDSLGGLDGQRNGSRDAPAGTSRSAQQHGSPVGGDDARTA
jgi:hypothetical protein